MKNIYIFYTNIYIYIFTFLGAVFIDMKKAGNILYVMTVWTAEVYFWMIYIIMQKRFSHTYGFDNQPTGFSHNNVSF